LISNISEFILKLYHFFELPTTKKTELSTGKNNWKFYIAFNKNKPKIPATNPKIFVPKNVVFGKYRDAIYRVFPRGEGSPLRHRVSEGEN